MDLFAKRLRDRARQLNLSDAEVARRAGLAERRYGHYVRSTHEPDYATLVRICEALDVTPNDLLLPAPAARQSSQGEAAVPAGRRRPHAQRRRP
jgi:transcriptional regulator with XRE-family HTH domain